MSSPGVPPALHLDAIYAKSKLFAERAIRARQASDTSQYQLWAALALELLGKAALARVHPCLVADPQNYQSLFAAAGKPIGVQIRTIAAHTVFDRIKHLDRRLDADRIDFCKDLSERRNSELHSGEGAFLQTLPAAWEGRYWSVAEILLATIEKALEDWIAGPDAKDRKDSLEAQRELVARSAAEQVQVARDVFEAQHKPAERKRLLEASRKITRIQRRELFDYARDETWPVDCPSCGGQAFLCGDMWEEETVDVGDDEWETVRRSYTADEFICPTCDLRFSSLDRIKGADIDPEFEIEVEQERTYEPDYGND